jgi:hypothetical protein
MLKLRRAESVDINVRIFLPDVLQKIDVPLERQFRMMPTLHQNLHSARCREFVEFLIDLLERQHVMIFVAFRPIKCAKFAVNVADVCVVDVPIDDVSHDLASTSAVTFRLCQVPSRISKRAQLFQRPPIQFERVVCRNPFARENSFRQRISIY